MSISNYEGPRGGDYARYVDELLRASPLHQRLGQVLEEASRSDFSGAVLSPGAQSGSVLTRLRERAQAQQQAQAASPGKAGKTPAKAAERQPRAARQALSKTAAPAAGQRNSWFRLTPGRVVGLLILAALSVALPGLGVLVLALAIINAVRRGIRSANESG